MLVVLLIDLIFILIVAIYEIKNLKSFLSWSVIILLFSIFGFLLYVFFGNALKFRAKKMLNKKHKSAKNYISKTSWYNLYCTTKTKQSVAMAKYVNDNFKSSLWHNNKVITFLNGIDFFNDLINEIDNAKSTINLEFYIIADDETGNILAKKLLRKANDGVLIKIVYDAFGCKKTSKKFWQSLKHKNIELAEFFPNLIKHINLKINYRNHRKIAVIDGKISYTGGINLRDDHMGKEKKLSPWRDTQIKIIGSATYALQEIFLNDFLFATNQSMPQNAHNLYFPKAETTGNLPLQILESGPEKQQPHIFNSYLFAINNAKKYIFIESPYFVLCKEMEKAIINALLRGVKVVIILPQKPDKKIVHLASLFSLKQLMKLNAKIYQYPKFIHSKLLITENVVSIGSCNFDNRSFFLNFEDTCLCYEKKFIFKQLQFVKKDIFCSKLITQRQYKKVIPKNIFYSLFYKIIYKFL